MGLKAWLEIGRVSNLPTCASNVAAGFIIAGGGVGGGMARVGAALVVVASFYEAGMVFNDLCDVDEDRLDRPGRPIPSGRVSPIWAWAAVVGLFALGWICVGVALPEAWPIAAALTALIVTYDLSHSGFAAAPLVLGACRGCVYLIGAVAATGALPGPEVWVLAGALAAYVSSVSGIARGETAASLSRGQKAALAATGASLLVPLLAPVPRDAIPVLTIAWATAAAWFASTARRLLSGRMPIGGGVGRLLAGMSLLDAVAISRAASIPGVALAWACFAATVLGHRRVRGT